MEVKMRKMLMEVKMMMEVKMRTMLMVLLQGRDICERRFCSMKRHFVSTGFKIVLTTRIVIKTTTVIIVI